MVHRLHLLDTGSAVLSGKCLFPLFERTCDDSSLHFDEDASQSSAVQYLYVSGRSIGLCPEQPLKEDSPLQRLRASRPVEHLRLQDPILVLEPACLLVG